MFTGIVEEVGEITGLRQTATSTVLGVRAKTVLGGTKLGDSIAVNGVCLTVVRLTADGFEGDVMPETMRRTNLGALRPKSRVNLERAMAADGRFGGHIVAGHVDGTGTITDLSPEGNAVWVTVSAAPNILRYIVEKGSITIDGISLTVAYVDNTCFKVSIIPHTGQETTLLTRKPGYVVNLECDIVGKYIEKLMQPAPEADETPSGGITVDFLAGNGFL
ncbi:riboflavin synthase [Butyricicoccus sp.]|uniref:riboflavin synthase n=1 Tax=Butyricicoccus sp. TaxID=2049021 RepID=UPI003F1766D6